MRASGGHAGTLQHKIASMLSFGSQKSSITEPAPVKINPQEMMISRLEIGCAGLCLVARNLTALTQCNSLATQGTLNHIFIALVQGTPPEVHCALLCRIPPK